MKKMLVLIALPLSMIGCANQGSIYRTFDISKGESPMVDIRQRAILVAPNKTVTESANENGSVVKISTDKSVVCAEPSPDAMAALAYELAAKGGVPDKGSVELGLGVHDSAVFNGIRTQSIQLLRDFGYRLCESYLSGAISSTQYDLLLRRYQKNTVALLAIEQLTGTVRAPTIVLTASGSAEATKSLVELRSVSEKLGDQVADLEKQLIDKTVEHDAASDDATKTKLKGQMSDLSGKIARLKDDKKAIDASIAQAKGVLVNGKTEVTISADASVGHRSDEHLQKVVDVVGGIVNNVVLSDDENQACIATLQASPNPKADEQFATYCMAELSRKQRQSEEVFDYYIKRLHALAEEISSEKDPNEKKKKEAERAKIEQILQDRHNKESESKKVYGKKPEAVVK